MNPKRETKKIQYLITENWNECTFSVYVYILTYYFSSPGFVHFSRGSLRSMTKETSCAAGLSVYCFF